jgi:hypothetical protein
MKKEAIGTYEVLAGTKHLGFVTAISLATAVAKAHGKFGKFVDVELALDRKARPSDRRVAARKQAAKTARRYPTDGFEARRAALIAEFEAAQ